MPVDYHLHTKMCGHAVGEMEEYVEAAQQMNLTEVGFSDHIPMYFLTPEKRDLSVAMSEANLSIYASRVKDIQSRYYPFPVKFGLEADYTPGMERELAAILRQFDFDYVIGSIHFLDGWGYDNPQYKAGYDHWDIDELYEFYFNTLCQAVDSGMFDILAHPDLIKKFGYRPTRDISDLYRKTVRKVADSGMCVEVNTAGLRVPVNEIYPNPEFLKLCFDAGVPITLGSDAHDPKFVGANFGEAVNLLKSIGYTEVVTFSGRNKNYCRI